MQDLPGQAASRHIVSVLRELGYRVSVRAIAKPVAYWKTIGNSRHKVQIGEVRWIEDYPALWDFFGTLLSCHVFFPDNPVNLNDSEYCKHPIEAQFQRALAARSPNAAGTLWADIDRKIVGQAPWVPLYNPRAMVVVSARVGNYQFHPLWRLLIDQLWVR